MPRKKKKKTDGPELPPLQFVESPLNHSPPVLSPDFGAINPITARAVAVEDIHDLSWVTPQFVNQPQYSRHCTNQTSRRTRRLRQKSEIHTKYDSNVASKYKPLSFMQNRKSSRHKRYSCNENEALFSNHDLTMEENQNSEQGGDLLSNSFSISTPVIERQEINYKNLVLPHEFSPNDHQSNGKKLSLNDQSRHDLSLTACLGPLDCDGEPVTVNSDGDDIRHELSVIFGKEKRLSLFDSLSSPPPSPIPPVLVTDTPECEYGLTMRQRQLKYFLRSKSKQKR